MLRWALRYPVSPFFRRWSILCDYVKLYRRKGLQYEEYEEFAFEKQSPEFRQQFLGRNEERFYLDFLNPKRYYILARNKYIAHKMLEERGIRKSELYCFYEPEGSIEGDRITSTLEGVCRILQQKGVSQCVIKAAESAHGDSVMVVNDIEYQEGDALLHLFNGQSSRLSEVLADTSLLFEGVVRQTEQLAALNPSSVNTVRFMTTLFPDGSAKVIATFIKIGRSGSCVDNAGAGGNVDAAIDEQSGTLRYAIRYDGARKHCDIDIHPDSGAQLNGVVIDNWQQIKEEVVRFQQAFPYIKAAGWDIAITDEGPVVIEVNDFWDRTGQAFIRRGWRNEIRACYFAWKKTGKRYELQRNSNMLSTRRLTQIAKRD